MAWLSRILGTARPTGICIEPSTAHIATQTAAVHFENFNAECGEDGLRGRSAVVAERRAGERAAGVAAANSSGSWMRQARGLLQAFKPVERNVDRRGWCGR